MAAAWWVLQLEHNEKHILKIRRRELRDLSNPFEIPESQIMALYR